MVSIPRRGLLLLLPLAGCRSPNPVLYSLVVPPGPVLMGGPKVVALRDVSLAGYLDRLQIVRSSDDYRLTVQENEWWGEPLGGMLTRVLVGAVSQRLPRSSVVGTSTTSALSPDATVEVSIQRLDADRAGPVTLAAQIAASYRSERRAPAVRPFIASVPQETPDTRGFVAAASVAVGQLADAIASMLRTP